MQIDFYKRIVRHLYNMRKIVFLVVCFFTAFHTEAQEVTGTVIDNSSGEPLIGVNIFKKDSQDIGTVTDYNGDYALNAMPGDVLIFSYIGYDTEEVNVSEGTAIYSVSMNVNSEVFDEVVIIGYGVAKKSDVTGAVASVDVDQLEKIASPGIARNLQGKVAGLTVNANSGAPGQGSTIQIRGVGSFQNASPLYVVDGFITGDVSNISPNEIESMEVLKDASATAIYGSRGANGVILITTKNGGDKEGNAVIELNSWGGFQTPNKTLDILNAQDYAELYLEAVSNGENNLDAIVEPSKRSWIQDGLGLDALGTDWQDVVFRDRACIMSHGINIRGSEGKVNYNLGGLYFDQEGIVNNTYSNRYQFNFGADMDVKSWLNLGAEIRYSRNEASNFDEDPFSGPLATALSKDPINPVYDIVTGDWNRTGLTDLPNPAKGVFLTQYNSNTWDRYVGTMRSKIKLHKNLILNSQVTLDQRRQSGSFYSPVVNVVEGRNLNSNFFPQLSSNESVNISSLTEEERNLRVLQISNYMTYNQSAGAHNLNAMIGTEAFQRLDQFNQLFVQDVPEAEALRYISLGGDLSSLVGRDNEGQYSLLSYFGRANYSYDNRYYFTATMRRDGSSKFADGNKWGTFPSFSAGWSIHNEAFFANNSLINRLKLRAGWGQVGNQDPIGNYATFALLSPNWNYALDNQTPAQGLAPNVLPATDLKWEVSEMLNFGIDFGFWEDQLTVGIDYFKKNTNDLLVSSIPTPGFAGANGAASNAASMVNTGIEVTAQYRARIGKLGLTIGGNISAIDNEVTDLGNGDFITGGNRVQKIGFPATRTLVGFDFASFFALETNGIFQNEGEVERHIALNADGLPIDARGNPLNNIEVDNGKVFGYYINDDGESVRAQARPLQRNAKPGDIRYQDANFDGKIDEDDLVFQGSSIPDFTYGGYINLDYANFDLSISMLGTQGNEIANIRSYWLQNSNPLESNLAANRINRWNGEGTSNTEPRVTNGLNDNSLYSDRFIEDGSYFRIRNIQLGYTIPKTILSSFGLSNIRVYVSGDNLLTVTGYSGLDPEIGSAFGDSFSPGVDYGVYPVAKTFIVGTNITF